MEMERQIQILNIDDILPNRLDIVNSYPNLSAKCVQILYDFETDKTRYT